MDLRALSLGIGVGPVGDVLGRDLAIAALLGVLAALFGIAHHARRGVVRDGLLAKIRICGRRCARRSAALRSACWRC